MRIRQSIAIAFVAALLGACGDGDDADDSASGAVGDRTTTSTTSTTAAPAEPTGPRLDGEPQRIQILGGPDWLAVDDSFVYTKVDSGRIDRIDPASGAVVGSASISGKSGVGGSGCQGIGIGFDSLWTCHGTDVVRFDLETLTETSRIDAGKAASQGHLATGFGRVWVLQGDGSTLVAIDPETDAVGEPIDLPIRGTDLAVGDDAVWVVSSLRGGGVVAVEPDDGSILHRIDDIDSPAGISIANDALWIGAADDVHRIDQTTGAIAATIPGGIGRAGAVAADGTGVWVRSENSLRHHDASGTETDAVALDVDGASPGDTLVAFGALWVSASEHATLFRFPLRAR